MKPGGLERKQASPDRRFLVLMVLVVLSGLLMALRLVKLQILDRNLYRVLAADQHDLEAKILPSRGRILIKDRTDGKWYPMAGNRYAWDLYAAPRDMKDPITAAHALAPILEIPDVDLISKFTKDPDDPYEPIRRDVSQEIKDQVEGLGLSGIGFSRRTARLYPEQGLGGQAVGVVTLDEYGKMVGRYGVEYSFDSLLAGSPGFVETETDAEGRRLIFGKGRLREAMDGSDILLTLDRPIQFKACEIIRSGVERYEADGGTIIVMEARTGAIWAMCSWPDFDPGNLREVEDVAVFNNPALFAPYEPGSVFKAFTMAAGINEEKVNPKTVYVDEGSIELDDFTIQNSDKQAHGKQTMEDVLDKSLNTGSIFVQQELGKKLFREYVQRFGFGKETGIELRPERIGDISSLERPGQVFAATASYGQGITATPIQLISAFSVLANKGVWIEPHIVEEIVHPDGTRDTEAIQHKTREVISRETAQTITRMLVNVVEGTHGANAAVPGYWVAGKTGTAQVAKQNSRGYEVGKVIASFIGYAPADDPEFVLLVKLDHPKKGQWGSETAAPLFGEMAEFLLRYLNISPIRPLE